MVDLTRGGDVFKIITDPDPINFEKRVSNALKLGWKLHGGMTVTPHGFWRHYVVWHQAIRKYTNE